MPDSLVLTKKWINDVISGLIEEVGSNDVYDIISYLNIKIIKDNEKQNVLFEKCDGIYIRNFFGNEVIIIKDSLPNEKFVLAHELGHALLHVDYDFLMNNPLSLNSKKEKEANYFATKLLYNDYKIEDGIETTEQLANMLGIKQDFIKFIIEK